MEVKTTKIPDKKATEAELQSLLDFIGGFEKWELLNEDCRREVVKYLDYKSRYQFGLCSKSNYATVEATPLYIKSMEISQTPARVLQDHVRVKIDFYTGKHISISFSDEFQDTSVRWNICHSVIWESTNYYEAALKFAENMMKKCNYELEAIHIHMFSYPFESSKIRMLPKCKNVRIFAKDGKTAKWWLARVPSQLSHCSLESFWYVLEEFCEYPQIQQATDFLKCEAKFSDEQLLKLNAKKIGIDATETGINQFMKKLINNGIPNFKKSNFRSKWEVLRDWNVEKLTDGLQFRKWKNDFETEEKAFCDEYWTKRGRGGKQYQIESLVVPYESFTLCVRNDRVCIFRPGTMQIREDGQPYTAYDVPS